MIALRAAWVLPISRPPLSRGWVAITDGRIVATGGADDAMPAGVRRVEDLGDAVVLPGLVNAHTHLELSWLRDRVPAAASFTSWIEGLFAARGRSFERVDDPVVIAATARAAREVRASGTAVVGDISNSLASLDALADAGLAGLVFHELLGFAAATGQPVIDARAVRQTTPALAHIRVTMAAHAPYSVSAELFRAIRAAVDQSEVPITSVHLGESSEEVAMLADGSGPWPALLRSIGAWREDWIPPGCGPLEYLDGLGVLDARTLVVHGVQLDDRALARLAVIGATLVTCPRSNEWVGVGAPPVGRFYAAGLRVALGTDSLASTSDLNLFAELAALRTLAPSVPARRLIETATRTGAEALGFGDTHGTLDPGKSDAIIAVTLPPAIADVEEYLLTGIAPTQIRWLHTEAG